MFFAAKQKIRVLSPFLASSFFLAPKPNYIEHQCASVDNKIFNIVSFQHLKTKKSNYMAGDSITMIDYMMWPWFERMEGMQLKQ
jgi:hypothetical protein